MKLFKIIRKYRAQHVAQNGQCNTMLSMWGISIYTRCKLRLAGEPDSTSVFQQSMELVTDAETLSDRTCRNNDNTR